VADEKGTTLLCVLTMTRKRITYPLEMLSNGTIDGVYFVSVWRRQKLGRIQSFFSKIINDGNSIVMSIGLRMVLSDKVIVDDLIPAQIYAAVNRFGMQHCFVVSGR
jgi:hypothetical protein